MGVVKIGSSEGVDDRTTLVHGDVVIGASVMDSSDGYIKALFIRPIIRK